MNKRIKRMFLLTSVATIFITGAVFLIKLDTEMSISAKPANTENYTVTDCVSDDNTHYVTMQNGKDNQEIVFEMGDGKYNRYDFSEKDIVTLGIGKTEEDKNVYFVDGERLLTTKEMNKATGMLENAVIIIAAIIALLFPLSDKRKEDDDFEDI